MAITGVLMSSIAACPDDDIAPRQRFARNRHALVVCLRTLAASLESLGEKIPLARQMAERYRFAASSLGATSIDGLEADKLADATGQLAEIAAMTRYTAERLAATLSLAAELRNRQATSH
jgi:hypothetical protein